METLQNMLLRKLVSATARARGKFQQKFIRVPQKYILKCFGVSYFFYKGE